MENMNELEKYTNEQLRAELKRRAEKAKAEREKVARCRNCVNMIVEMVSGVIPFTKCKVNTYKLHGKDVYKVTVPSSKACKKYEKKVK